MRVLGLQGLGEEVYRPESTVSIRTLGRPSPLRVAVETMNQDDIYPGTWVGVNGSDVETGDLPVDGPLNVKSARQAPKTAEIM